MANKVYLVKNECVVRNKGEHPLRRFPGQTAKVTPEEAGRLLKANCLTEATKAELDKAKKAEKAAAAAEGGEEGGEGDGEGDGEDGEGE